MRGECLCELPQVWRATQSVWYCLAKSQIFRVLYVPVLCEVPWELRDLSVGEVIEILRVVIALEVRR